MEDVVAGSDRPLIILVKEKREYWSLVPCVLRKMHFQPVDNKNESLHRNAVRALILDMFPALVYNLGIALLCTKIDFLMFRAIGFARCMHVNKDLKLHEFKTLL